MSEIRLLMIGLLAALTAHSQDPVPPVSVLRTRLAAAKEDTARADVLFDLAQAYIDQGEGAPRSMDTALEYIRLAAAIPASQTDTRLKGWHQVMLARTFRVRNGQLMHDSALSHVYLAIEILKPYPRYWAKACAEAGFILLDAKDAHEDSLQIQYFRKAIPVFDSLGEKFWLAQSLEFVGGAIRNPKESLSYLNRALQTYRSVPHPDLRRLYSRFAQSYTAMGDQQQALHFALLAVRAEDSLGAPDHNSVLTYNEAGVCFYRVGDLKHALTYALKATELSIRYNDLNAIRVNANGVVKIYTNLGNYDSALAVLRRISASYPPTIVPEKVLAADGFAGLYQRLGKTDSMDIYVRQLFQLDGQLAKDHRYRIYTLPRMIDYANRRQEYPIAQQYARELIRTGRTQALPSLLVAAYEGLATADSALGNYRSALADYRQYVYLRDSVRDAGNAKQIAALNLQYETEKKDKDIQSLNHKQQLSELALHQAGLTRNFIIAGAILLFVLLAVSINRYRLKQRSNRQLNRILSEKDLLLTEKEWLLKEIHHRVKNNLQIGISLLNLQSYHIENEKAQSAIRQSRNRMYAMSLIHQRLYQSDDLKTIDMHHYIGDLVNSIRDSYASEQEIEFRLSVQPIELDVEYALPIGLILNEAITNSLKYAFPQQRRGRISISLETAHSQMILSIADNGIGLPDDFDIRKPASMGTQLIDILVQQLDGQISMTNKNGLSLTVRFPDPTVAVHSLFSGTRITQPTPQFS